MFKKIWNESKSVFAVAALGAVVSTVRTGDVIASFGIFGAGAIFWFLVSLGTVRADRIRYSH